MNTKRIIQSVIYIILGGILFTLGVLEKVESIWSGFGGGLLGTGIVFLVRGCRYNNDPEYRETVDTAAKDERYAFLRMKSWSWTGYTMILLWFVIMVVLMVQSQYKLAQYVSLLGVCLPLVLYLIFYAVLKNKY